LDVILIYKFYEIRNLLAGLAGFGADFTEEGSASRGAE
jgi:hypothetical protein